jgi:predicted transcriptional regulator
MSTKPTKTIRFDQRTIDQIEQIAEAQDATMSQVIRAAVSMYITEHGVQTMSMLSTAGWDGHDRD